MSVEGIAATYGLEDMSRIGQYGVDIRMLIFVIIFQNPNDIAYVVRIRAAHCPAGAVSGAAAGLERT